MNFEEWEPHYLRIVKEFGFSVEEDDRSAHILAELCKKLNVCSPACLKRRIGEEVTVLGHGPNLEYDLHRKPVVGTIICADGATTTIMDELGMVPDIIVTDLDGNVADQIAANAQGAVAVILAHGDNSMKLREYVPWFSGLVTPTTQARPFDDVFNFGGFTDGDRAVLLARHMGTHRIHLRGFDFDTPRPKSGRDISIKSRKLVFARDLIYSLNPDNVEVMDDSYRS